MATRLSSRNQKGPHHLSADARLARYATSSARASERMSALSSTSSLRLAALASSGDHFVVLDPSAPPRFSVFSINHASLKARIYRVGPENWGQFLTFMRSNDQNAERTPPGRLVFSNTIAVQAQPDEMAETRIDLAPALEGGFGHVFIIVEPPVRPKNRWERRQVMAWAQVTAIGLDAFVDGSELIGWATSLKDGKPVDGVQMTIAAAQSPGLRQGTSGVTRADGLAHIALPANAPSGQNILVARKGKDVAILPENQYWWNERGGWFRREARGFAPLVCLR